ncbi:DUF3500 domain-containing protein [Akkermansiaceae bacterium]|nr:DUF3500 domain-containing protein [Akkermansiaceae bacterium]
MKLPLILALTVASTFAHEGHLNDATEDMEKAAKGFLTSLNEEQKKQATFEFKNQERENWHFIPMDDRKGIRFGTLRPHQQHLAFGLLGTGLTQKGLLTATQIMTLEQILADRGEDPEKRNTEKYFISIFGDPSGEKPWGWRFEGHHLSLNFTVAGDNVLGVPTFFGSNPAELQDGPMKGMRPLGEVEDLARAFAKSLVAAQMSPVFSEKPPGEIITAQTSVAKAPEKLGVSSADFDGEKIKQLSAIIESVASLRREELNNTALRKVYTVQRKKMNFAWAGSLERGKAHYFRIQGPDFVIEYANTQNDANHAHLVWRDLKNDFGRDLMRKHYAEEHKN